jgi:hypothetical protein
MAKCTNSAAVVYLANQKTQRALRPITSSRSGQSKERRDQIVIATDTAVILKISRLRGQKTTRNRDFRLDTKANKW